MLGILATIATRLITAEQIELTTQAVLHAGVWRMFSFTILSTIGAIVMEMLLPDPDLVKFSKERNLSVGSFPLA